MCGEMLSCRCRTVNRQDTAIKFASENPSTVKGKKKKSLRKHKGWVWLVKSQTHPSQHPRVTFVSLSELSANVLLVISWPAAVSLLLIYYLPSLPAALLSNGSMVGYLKQLLASKTRKQVYSSSTDVLFL